MKNIECECCVVLKGRNKGKFGFVEIDEGPTAIIFIWGMNEDHPNNYMRIPKENLIVAERKSVWAYANVTDSIKKELS